MMIVLHYALERSSEALSLFQLWRLQNTTKNRNKKFEENSKIRGNQDDLLFPLLAKLHDKTFMVTIIKMNS
jgi:hypothetical protein